jgi:hypothetical protein
LGADATKFDQINLACFADISVFGLVATDASPDAGIGK